MLHRKARPKRKRLLSNFNNSHNVTTESKDCSNSNLYKVLNKLNGKLSSLLLDIKYTSISNKFNNKLGLTLLNSIPVLSIFVLLGIIAYSTIVINPSSIKDLISLGLTSTDGEVYAAESTSNTSSLIIDNGDLTQSNNTTTEGNITYSSHTVQVVANNIEGYSLNITGPANMTTANTSNPTTIAGADNKTPANMSANSWGYAWTNNTNATNDSLYYQSFDNNKDQVLSSSSSVSSVDFINKLVFAVKFGSDATSGHYRANVKLNLTVTPKAVAAFYYTVTYDLKDGTNGPPDVNGTINAANLSYTIPDNIPIRAGYEFLGYSKNDSSTVHYDPSDSILLTAASPNVTLYAVWKLVSFEAITTMQEMTGDLCKITAIGVSATLRDTRDTNSYTVQKLSDGNCWMTQNLKLDLSKAGVATSAASDNLSSNYPASAITASTKFSSTSATAQAWTSSPTVNTSNPGDGKGYQSAYGYYYTWCAATAGTCTNSNDAPSSICPKGWKLPKGGTTVAKNTAASQTGNDFANLAGLSSTSNVSWSSNVFAGPPAYFTLGGANWYRAGGVLSNGLGSPGSVATYWSRTVYDGSTAYALTLDGSGNLRPADTYSKYRGNSVRCVAYSS